jgi:hypothetical protein
MGKIPKCKACNGQKYERENDTMICAYCGLDCGRLIAKDVEPCLVYSEDHIGRGEWIDSTMIITATIVQECPRCDGTGKHVASFQEEGVTTVLEPGVYRCQFCAGTGFIEQ